MNNFPSPKLDSDVLFVRKPDKHCVPQAYVPDHTLCHIVAGEMRLVAAAGAHHYQAGNTVLLRRNTLVKLEKRPVPGQGPFQAIFLLLPQPFLQAYALQQALPASDAATHEPVRLLPEHPMLRGLFQSLQPYLGEEPGMDPGKTLTHLKQTEAVLALLTLDPALAGWLFDFAEAGKLDLAAFMHQHYIFNVPIARFAQLTGRSVSTFQRDFYKHFGMAPALWLRQRRLEAAHAALLLPGKKTSDVYLEVGFEDVAHFSRTFKQAFGYNPSQAARQALVPARVG
ncbi:helix-turn-helix domain-containing protein [Hymenobacter volaticus]|uniref:AraC family transcriptional regulator n=1 Tax=Hymenobacter volaticus TaxID=2932254 RepID=A0ABY4GET6_9BACT|nr:AraC family transcriptional regulator [Hymenobacter volaticus]UOQ69445.1 AraC family transcriptional regulator [Hymenobacter volaticus]